MVAVLFDSGCRIGELLKLKLKNVQFDNYGAVIIVNGKTGSRRVRLIFSVPNLSNWINNHPFNNDKESFLWTTLTTRNNGNMISYNKIREVLVNIAKKADVKKRVNPHSFRYARATNLAQFLTEAQMKEFFGWTQLVRWPLYMFIFLVGMLIMPY